jgi:hypothetical protein
MVLIQVVRYNRYTFRNRMITRRRRRRLIASSERMSAASERVRLKARALSARKCRAAARRTPDAERALDLGHDRDVRRAAHCVELSFGVFTAVVGGIWVCKGGL